MGDNRFIKNLPPITEGINEIKTVQIGNVVSVSDAENLGRIKVRIPGQANLGGDGDTKDADLPWSYPMLPKYFTSQPKVGEAVFILTFTNQRAHSDRLYFGPIISQLNKNNLKESPILTSALNSFTFASTTPLKAIDTVSELKNVFPKANDVAIQGRYNTDILLRENEIQIRAGKFVEVAPNENNPYDFKFNNTTQGLIQIKNNIAVNKSNESGSVINVMANKINLITYKDGSPRYNMFNNNNEVNDTETLNFITTAHPIPFGDKLVEYLILLRNAFVNHVHRYSGIPPTDLTVGETLPLQEFKTKAEKLENEMLSKNIHIN